jgi:hypothetical protein
VAELLSVLFGEATEVDETPAARNGGYRRRPGVAVDQVRVHAL